MKQSKSLQCYARCAHGLLRRFNEPDCSDCDRIEDYIKDEGNCTAGVLDASKSKFTGDDRPCMQVSLLSVMDVAAGLKLFLAANFDQEFLRSANTG